MATRSPTPFHSSWGSHPTVSLPSGSEVQVGDTAYDTTLGKLVVCTSIGPVVWSAVGGATGGKTAISFQGEVTGTTPLVVGAVYLTSGTLLLGASSALLGTVSGGTATLRLVRQSTGVPLCSWVQPGALASTTLGGNANVTASDWYVFDLVGSAAGTVSRAYGARLEV